MWAITIVHIKIIHNINLVISLSRLFDSFPYLTSSFWKPTLKNGKFLYTFTLFWCISNRNQVKKKQQRTKEPSKQQIIHTFESKTASSHKIISVARLHINPGSVGCASSTGQHKSIQLHVGCECMHFWNGKKGFPVVLRFHSGVVPHTEWMNE